MKRKNKNVSRETFLFFFIVLIFANSVISISASDQIGLVADATVLIDAKNGSIYNSSDSNTSQPMGDCTQLLTAYVVLEQMEEQGIELSDTITISQRAAYIKTEQPYGSGVYLDVGEKMTYDVALQHLLVISDNGVAIALAENIAKTEDDFVTMMNDTAQELGMENTVVYNASGLTSEQYGEIMIEGMSEQSVNKTTADDVALLSMNLINSFPQVLDITSQTSITYEGEQYLNSNYLINPDSSFYYEGVKGLMGGANSEEDNCMIGYYESENTNDSYISVILGADSSADAYNQTTYMFNWIDLQTQYIVLSEDYEWYMQIEGDSTNEEVVLSPSKNYESITQDYIDAHVVEYFYNEKYFDSNGKLIKEIPEGEVVVSVYLQDFDDNIINDNVESNVEVNGDASNYLELELVSRETIKKENFIDNLVEGTKDYLIGLYNNII